MRVLLLGSHINYNLEHYVYMNLVKLGYEVKFYGYKEKLGRLTNTVRMTITRSKLLRDMASTFLLNKINDEIKKIAEQFHPDLMLSIKGEAVKPETVEYIKEVLRAKTALWYPDDPRFFKSLVRYIAPSYDHVFTASSRMIPMYKEMGCKDVHFLPFACEETVHRRVALSNEDRRKYGADVVFVGTYTPRRAKIVKALEKAGIKVKVYGPYWKYFKFGDNIHDGIYGLEMVKAFNAAKIVLNVHIGSDLPYKVNMRTFEATGSGVFLLTDYAYGLEKMFEIGKELVVYNGNEDLTELAKHYLGAEEERNQISWMAQDRAYKEHTYFNRVGDLISKVT